MCNGSVPGSLPGTESEVSSMPMFSLSADSWDLHRRADRDWQRHNEKVKEIIKKNLGDIISQQDIITAENGKIRFPDFVFTIRDEMRDRSSCGASVSSRTRPLGAPDGS